MPERKCGSCDEMFDHPQSAAKYCSDECRMRAKRADGPFTGEMLAELYEDALAGRIEAWQSS